MGIIPTGQPRPASTASLIGAIPQVSVAQDSVEGQPPHGFPLEPAEANPRTVSPQGSLKLACRVPPFGVIVKPSLQNPAALKFVRADLCGLALRDSAGAARRASFFLAFIENFGR